MKPYRALPEASAVVSLVAAAAPVTYFKDQFLALVKTHVAGAFPGAEGLTVTAVFLLVLGAIYLFTRWAMNLLLQMGWFRRLFLLGYYIEGTWIEKIIMPDGKPRIAIVNIQPDGYGFAASGDNYDWNTTTNSPDYGGRFQI